MTPDAQHLITIQGARSQYRLPEPAGAAVLAGRFALRGEDGHLWPAGKWFVVSEGDDTFWLATLENDKLVALGTS